MLFNTFEIPSTNTAPRSKLYNFLANLVSIGSRHSKDGRQLRGLQLANSLALTYGVLMIPYVYLFYSQGFHKLASLLFLCFLSLIPVLLLNHIGFLNSGKLLLIWVTNITILFFSYNFGQDTQIHLLFIPMLVSPSLLFADFRRSSRLGAIAGTAMPVAIMIWLEFHKWPPSTLSPAAMVTSRWITLFTLFTGSITQQIYWQKLFRKHEIQLASQKIFLQNVIENLPVALFCKDTENDSKLVVWNKSAEQTWGIPSESIMDKKSTPLLASCSRDAEVMTTNKLLYIPEETLTLPNGEEKILRSYKVPISGRFLLGISEDITELRRIEQERSRIAQDLQTHNRHLETLLANMSDGLVLQDSRGKIIQFNDAALKILGLTSDQLIGRDSFDPKWRAIRENGLRYQPQEHPAVEALETGQVQRNRMMGVHRSNGEVRWLSVTAAPLFLGISTKAHQVLVTFRDITESRKKDIEIEAAHSDLKNFFSVSTDFLAITTHDGSLKKFNPKFVEILGFSEAELRKGKIQDCMVSEDRQQLTTELQNLGTRNLTANFIYRCLSRSQQELLVSWKATCSTDGETIFLSGRDITEERAQEILLLQSSKMSSLGEMSAGIAHEINNPLAIISGKAQQLLSAASRGESTPQSVAKNAETIVKTVDRVSTIIKGLRTFARDAELDPVETVPIKTLINDALSFCSSRFMHHHVELRMPTIDETLTTECRPAQISQVLVNLLGNAFDAVQTLPGEKWVEILIQSTANGNEIRIRDSGSGIPAALRSKIMQPFFTTKVAGKGTGLGLSISSGIIKSHGGSLEVDAEDPHTCFKISLPFNQVRKAS